jgi:hypothetical protein
MPGARHELRTAYALWLKERVAHLLTGQPDANPEDGIVWLQELTAALSIPGLASYRLSEDEILAVVTAAQKASSCEGTRSSSQTQKSPKSSLVRYRQGSRRAQGHCRNLAFSWWPEGRTLSTWIATRVSRARRTRSPGCPRNRASATTNCAQLPNDRCGSGRLLPPGRRGRNAKIACTQERR